MPAVLRVGPYRLFFYAGDRDEPRHVHVERSGNIAKFWLNPVRLQSSGGFSLREIGRVQRMVQQHEQHLVEAWDGYFRR